MRGPATPLPPVELVTRVGTVEGADPLEFYNREGARLREKIVRLLPEGWSLEGKRALDFGCGSARVLRQFLDEAQDAELWGCDIDGPSIDWVKTNLSPPLHCFQNGRDPPLPLADSSFDLVWAMSVFTHIDPWSDWLVEMHRILVPGGFLIASFLGEGIWEALLGEPYSEDEVGMTVLRHWEPGGPWVFHSEWWLREHWGRAFEVLEVDRPPRGDDGSPEITHSYIAMRKGSPEINAEELERCDAREGRELAGLRTNLRLLRGEIDELIDERRKSAGPASSLRRAVLRSRLGARARTLHRRMRGLPP